MDLKDLLVSQVESLGLVRFSNSFGWICVYTGKNLFGGIKVVDDNILLLFLILSPAGFESSLNDAFEKFEFGKTWAQTEITGEEDFPRVFEYVKDAFDYSKEREKIKSLKSNKS